MWEKPQRRNLHDFIGKKIIEAYAFYSKRLLSLAAK